MSSAIPSRRMDAVERWLADACRVAESPGGVLECEIDMSGAKRLLERMRVQGVRCTYNHFVVRAAALALARHPELAFSVAGNRRVLHDQIDVTLSVSADSFVAPLMRLEDAGRRELRELAGEISARAPQVRAEHEQNLARARIWGWLVPFGFLRRWIVRRITGSAAMRRKVAGTIQITCVPSVDRVLPNFFLSAAALGVGAVRERAVAIDGALHVRPTLWVCCPLDHKAWDGQRAATFLNELRVILEQEQLESECEPVHARAKPERVAAALDTTAL
jgi:hypothetical protein